VNQNDLSHQFLHFRNIFSSEMLLLLGQGPLYNPLLNFAPIILSVPLALCMMGNKSLGQKES
jgi:hypothetical protein